MSNCEGTAKTMRRHHSLARISAVILIIQAGCASESSIPPNLSGSGLSKIELASFVLALFQIVADREPECRQLTDHEKWYLANVMKAAQTQSDGKLVNAYRNMMSLEKGCHGQVQTNVVRRIKEEAARY